MPMRLGIRAPGERAIGVDFPRIDSIAYSSPGSKSKRPGSPHQAPGSVAEALGVPPPQDAPIAVAQGRGDEVDLALEVGNVATRFAVVARRDLVARAVEAQRVAERDVDV
jgi:hypothetical protein